MRVLEAVLCLGLAGVPVAVAAQTAPAAPAAVNAAFVPQPILQGGEIFVLFPPGSPFLKADRVAEPEQNKMSRTVPGRISSIVNIHNPTIELHRVETGINTGAAVILVAGGGHNTLNVGTEGADFVPFFFNYGVTTIILRNRLRKDGYNAQTDAVYDAQQAIRMVRAHAQEWGIDPHKIGMLGFSAGAELVAPAALAFDAFDKANGGAGDPLARREFASGFRRPRLPRPDAVRTRRRHARPCHAPPAFITCAGSGDAQHAIWADQYFGGDAEGAHPECRDAHLRQRRARERAEGSRRHAVRHVAVPLHRLVPRPWLPGQARRGDQGGKRRCGLRRLAASSEVITTLVLACGCLSSRGAALWIHPRCEARRHGANGQLPVCPSRPVVRSCD